MTGSFFVSLVVLAHIKSLSYIKISTMLLLLVILFVGLAHAFIPFEAKNATSSILVFGGTMLQNSAVNVTTVGMTGVGGEALTEEGRIVQEMVNAFEQQFGEISQHLFIKMLVKNPIFSTIKEPVEFVLDPGAQQFILSLDIAKKLQLPTGNPCMSRFGDGASMVGFKSFVFLHELVPPQDGASPFPVGVAVCVQNTSWNLLSGNFLTITGRCQCNAPGRVGLYGCTNDEWI